MDWQSLQAVADVIGAEPVHLDEAKKHCNVDVDEDDEYIAALISTAREYVEDGNGRAIVVRTFEAALDCFPCGDILKLPRPPLISVESITYVLEDGTEAVVDPDTYVVDTRSQPGRVILRSGESWPSETLQAGPSVIVRYVAGMITPITSDFNTGSITVFGRTFNGGDPISLWNTGGALPEGLEQRRTYYVNSGDDDVSTFGLATTPDLMELVTISDDGSGQSFAGRPRYLLHRAILLLVGHWYENREAVQEARRTVILELPLGIRNCILTDRIWKF